MMNFTEKKIPSNIVLRKGLLRQFKEDGRNMATPLSCDMVEPLSGPIRGGAFYIQTQMGQFVQMA